MKLSHFLSLGRVSNLPTVWSNVLAALALTGTGPSRAVGLSLILSTFYVGGMFLNDAFDAEFDRRYRPDRPIASGVVSQRSVFLWGYGMLLVGLLALFAEVSIFSGGAPFPTLLSGLALAAFILLYNAWHKNNPLSPLVMGACRVAVYTTAGLAVSQSLPSALFLGALGLLSYLIGLTYAAKQENLRMVKQSWPLLFLLGPLLLPWRLSSEAFAESLLIPIWLILAAWLYRAYRLLCPRGSIKAQIPKAVGALIAGISLWDAVLCAAAGAPTSAILACLCFGATLLLHRRIAGT